MPPIDRRRRRRRLSRAQRLSVVGVLVGGVVLATLIGGLLDASSQSKGYERAVDRSYAAQIRLVVAASNRLGRAFHVLLGAMPGERRTSLEVALDTLVRSSSSLAQQAETAASPAPSGGAGAEVAAAMADRADAMLALRTTVDQLLGMAPITTAGVPGPGPSTGTSRLSAAGAATALARVGTLLAQGDRRYAAGRRTLRRAPGRADLPSSVWSGRTAAWTSAGTSAMVQALTGSPTLAAVHRVVLAPHTLALTPAAVPAVGTNATPGVAVVPPTSKLGISVVVANDGNVSERGIVVQASIQDTSAGSAVGTGSGTTTGTTTPPTTTVPTTTPPTSTPPTTTAPTLRQGRRERVSLAPRSSVAVTLPPLPVTPGRRYTVEVTVDPPLPNTPGTAAAQSLAIRVAPPGPPTVVQLVPTKGKARGGADVTIFGSGYTWVRSVTFGTTKARFKVVSSTQITAVAPPGTGTVAVHVANIGGESPSTTFDLFHYHRK